MKRMLCMVTAIVVTMAVIGCVFDASGLKVIDHGQCVTAYNAYAYVGDTITWSMDMAPNTIYGGINPQIPNYDRSYNIFLDGVNIGSSGMIKSTEYSMEATQPGVYTAVAYLYDEGNIHEGHSGPVHVAMPLTIAGVIPNKSVSTTGVPITWTVYASGGFISDPIFGVIYSWGVRRGSNIVAISGGWKSASSFTYTPEEPGDYSVEVSVNDHIKTVEGLSGITKVTQDLAISSVEVKKFGEESVTADKTSAVIGERIRWFANAAGGEGPGKYTFAFDIYKDNILIEDNSFPGGKFNGWSMTFEAMGIYWAIANVFDGKNYASRISPATVVNGPLEIVSVKANRASAPVGAEIIWTITTKGGLDTKQYRFQLIKGNQAIGMNVVSVINNYATIPLSADEYFMRGSVTDSITPSLTMDSAHIQVTASSTLVVKSVQVDTYSSTVGQKITWTASAMGGSGNRAYKFNVCRDGALYKAGVFSPSNKLAYTPDKTGVYNVQVYVKDSTGTSPAVTSAQTVVHSLVTLSGALTPVFLLPDTLYANISLPAFASVRATSLPLDRITATRTPSVSIITAEPIPVEPTDFPYYLFITDYIVPTPTPYRID